MYLWLAFYFAWFFLENMAPIFFSYCRKLKYKIKMCEQKNHL